MDTTKILADVGMVLVHNGVVRGWARADHAPVKSMKVSHDRAKMDAICREMEQQPGIFCIHAEAVEGELKPGDDVLFLVVAGDIREHVKATFSELLDRIKAEAAEIVDKELDRLRKDPVLSKLLPPEQGA